jgi:hypothetical protein
MSDEKALIDRLREMASDKNACRYSIGDYWNVCDEAAAEIESLRDALMEILEQVESHPLYEPMTIEEEIAIGGDAALLACIGRIASEALRSKR